MPSGVHLSRAARLELRDLVVDRVRDASGRYIGGEAVRQFAAKYGVRTDCVYARRWRLKRKSR